MVNVDKIKDTFIEKYNKTIEYEIYIKSLKKLLII